MFVYYVINFEVDYSIYYEESECYDRGNVFIVCRQKYGYCVEGKCRYISKIKKIGDMMNSYKFFVMQMKM